MTATGTTAGDCPDDGACHHGCPADPGGTRRPCWRVRVAGPLSGVFPGDRWPGTVTAAHTVTRNPMYAAGMESATYLVCSACHTTACADGRVCCDESGTADLTWAATPYPPEGDTP